VSTECSGTGLFGMADAFWPFRSEPFRYEPFRSEAFWSGPFRSGDISVTTFLCINNWSYLFI